MRVNFSQGEENNQHRRQYVAQTVKCSDGKVCACNAGDLGLIPG